MVQRAFATEDGSPSVLSITTSRTKPYKDIDLTFEKRSDGDVYKKTEISAVKQSVKNILMTQYYEKPFDMTFGSQLNDLLFELADNELEWEIEDAIRQAINIYEPRAAIRSVNVNVDQDNYDVRVTVNFAVLNYSDRVSLDIVLTRLR